MRMGNPFCSQVLFVMFLFSYHVEISWRLSVAELWVAACSSPLCYLCCWQQMEHWDRNEWEFYSAPSPFHWTLPLFSTVLLANKMINQFTKYWKLPAPWTILLFPCSSNFSFTITLLLNLILQLKSRLTMKICRFTCCSSWYTLQKAYEKRHLF